MDAVLRQATPVDGGAGADALTLSGGVTVAAIANKSIGLPLRQSPEMHCSPGIYFIPVIVTPWMK